MSSELTVPLARVTWFPLRRCTIKKMMPFSPIAYWNFNMVLCQLYLVAGRFLHVLKNMQTNFHTIVHFLDALPFGPCSYAECCSGIVLPVWKKCCCHLARLLLFSHVECSKAPFLGLFYCICSRWALLLENMPSHFTFMQMTLKSTWNPWKQTTLTVLSTCLIVSRTLKLGWPWLSGIFLKTRLKSQCLDPVVAPDAPLVLESHIWKPS